MSLNPPEDAPARYAVDTTAATTAATTSPPEDENTTRKNPISPFNHSNILPNPSPSAPCPPALTCPVRGCSLIFDGKTPFGYLWRHLRRPGIHKRTGEEKDAWQRLHKIELDRLAATGSTAPRYNESISKEVHNNKFDIATPVQRKREANRARARKVRERNMLKAARSELRAGNRGIREKKLAAQKVVIREGMHAAKKRGDNIAHDAWVLLDFCTNL